MVRCLLRLGYFGGAKTRELQRSLAELSDTRIVRQVRFLSRLTVRASSLDLSIIHDPPVEIVTTYMTSNLVGILFARSLHYQFYSWYAYQVPLLAWRTRYPIILK